MLYLAQPTSTTEYGVVKVVNFINIPYQSMQVESVDNVRN
jgi:hypothetical protein